LKKHLLSTSAIALGVAMTAPVSAQEWDMKWGGYYETHVGYVTVDSDTAAHNLTDWDGVDTFTDAEIHFRPSVTLDNGMTFGVNVQYEAQNTGGNIVDESYMSISSDTLGRIDIGNENSAGYKMMVAAPEVGGVLGINSGSLSGFIPISTGAGGNLPWNGRQAGQSSYTEVLGNNDVSRITYYTPSFNGLTLGVSYAATANGANAGNNYGVDRNVGVNDVWDFGIAYSQSFNGVDLNLAGRYGMAENDTPNAGTDDPETWGLGASMGVSGWTFGGAYAENDNGGLMPDEEGWSLGVAYDIPGPWEVGLETYQGEWTQDGAKAEYEAYQLAASRTLGKGVLWSVYAVYAQGTADAVVTGDLTDTEVEGTLIGTSVSLSF
jgi:predicted porin